MIEMRDSFDEDQGGANGGYAMHESAALPLGTVHIISSQLVLITIKRILSGTMRIYGTQIRSTSTHMLTDKRGTITVIVGFDTWVGALCADLSYGS